MFAGEVHVHVTASRRNEGVFKYMKLSCRLVLLHMALRRMENVPRDTCYVSTLAVDERFRGRGIGSKMLEFADAQARNYNCKVSLKTRVYLV